QSPGAQAILPHCTGLSPSFLGLADSGSPRPDQRPALQRIFPRPPRCDDLLAPREYAYVPCVVEHCRPQTATALGHASSCLRVSGGPFSVVLWLACRPRRWCAGSVLRRQGALPVRRRQAQRRFRQRRRSPWLKPNSAKSCHGRTGRPKPAAWHIAARNAVLFAGRTLATAAAPTASARRARRRQRITAPAVPRS